MDLISEEFRKRLPDLGSVAKGKPIQEWIAQVCLVDAHTRMCWYLIEFDGQDRFFGLMAGKHSVAGEFSLAELEGLGGEKDRGVYLDRSFEPTPVIDLARQNKAIAELLPSEGLVDLVR